MVFGCLEKVSRGKHTNMLNYLKVEKDIILSRTLSLASLWWLG